MTLTLEASPDTVERTDEPAAPDPDFWRGRLFPNDCNDPSSSFERIERTATFDVDYLPTPAVIAMAAGFHGPRSHDLLDRWRRLWVTALGDDVAGAVAARAPRHGEGLPGWAANLRGKAAHLLATGHPGSASDTLYDVMIHEEEGIHRDPAYHVLQDAVRHLALVEEGTPFRLCAGIDYDKGAVGLLAVPDGAGGLRLVEEQGQRRSAYRTIRSINGARHPYWKLAAFRERCGRPIAWVKGVRHMVLALMDMAGQGHRKAFVKGCNVKSGTWVVDLPPGEGVTALAGRVIRLLGGAGLNRSSWQTSGFLVQAFVPFLREHRFLVVSNRVVASTASVREIGVLDAEPTRIIGPGVALLHRPPWAEGTYDRGDADHVEDRALLARMAAGARDLARAMTKELDHPAFRESPLDCHCIDMGETEDGRVLPIEVNCLSRCGLYAADYRRVARALTKRAKAIDVRLESGASPEEARTPRVVNLPDKPAWLGNGPFSEPGDIRTILEIHDLTGWPIVGVAEQAHIGDGKVADHDVIGWAVRAPDGRLTLGRDIHGTIADYVDRATMRLSGNGPYAASVVHKAAFVAAIERHAPDWLLAQAMGEKVDDVLDRLGWPVRPEMTRESISEAGIVAYPGEPSVECIGYSAYQCSPRDQFRMACVPTLRSIAERAGIPHPIAPEAAAGAMLADPDAIPVDWSREAWPRDSVWWPLPRRPEQHVGYVRDIMGIPMGSAEGRIAAILAAHAPRVGLMARIERDLVSVGLALRSDPNRERGTPPGAADLWELCVAYVVCGQVPPVALALATLAAGAEPDLPPEAASAVKRSLSSAIGILRSAETVAATL